MTAYSPYVTDPGYIVRSVTARYDAAGRGTKVRTWWGGDGLDADALREWFRSKVDGLINLKAGLREDGAPARWKGRAADDRRFRRFVCRCRRCDHERAHHHGNTAIRARVNACCTRCDGLHAEWGGRKWEGDWVRAAHRDQWALRNRRNVRRFETEVVRDRFAEREYRED